MEKTVVLVGWVFKRQISQDGKLLIKELPSYLENLSLTPASKREEPSNYGAQGRNRSSLMCHHHLVVTVQSYKTLWKSRWLQNTDCIFQMKVWNYFNHELFYLPWHCTSVHLRETDHLWLSLRFLLPKSFVLFEKFFLEDKGCTLNGRVATQAEIHQELKQTEQSNRECKNRKTNLCTTWIDYKKSYELSINC